MSSKFSLENKVAIITGGTGVLGSSIAMSFCKSGVKVVVLGRHKDKIDQIVPGTEIDFYVKEIIKDKIILTQIL